MDEKTFLHTAFHSYDNPQCLSVSEFETDVRRFFHIKRALLKAERGTAVDIERRIINNLIICFNVFGANALDMLFYKVEPELWGMLIPYLVWINRLPDSYLIDGKIPWVDIPMDKEVVNKLREM